MTKKLVLSVSGGGALGVGPLHFMTRLEEDLGLKEKGIGSVCSAFAGTSTGSIIASWLCDGKPAKELFDIYKKELKNIFKRAKTGPFSKLPVDTDFFYIPLIKGFSINNFLDTNLFRYDNTGLKNLLKKYFEGNMDAFKKPIFIPTTFMNGKSVEKVWDPSDRTVSREFAILSSCSAPTYFDTVKDGKGNEYCDGGMWANDPIMVLESGIKNLCKKKKVYREEFEEGFKILSFNTGMEHPNKAPAKKDLFGWLGYIMDEWVARTGNSNHFEACANIGAENIFRCCPKSDKTYKMDDLKVINDVIEEWDGFYRSSGTYVCKFIESTM
jgi:hypothetical protein